MRELNLDVWPAIVVQFGCVFQASQGSVDGISISFFRVAEPEFIKKPINIASRRILLQI